MAVEALLLVAAPPGLADPGAPGLDRPSTAVYQNTAPPPVLGVTPPVSPDQPPKSNNGPVSAPDDTLGGSGGGGNVGGALQGSGGDGGGGTAGDVDSLPFTGLSAALVLAAGLAALLLGLTMRAAAGRLRRA